MPFLSIAPDPRLKEYIRSYWILKDSSKSQVCERTLPVGCVQMIFHRGAPLQSKAQSISLQPCSFITGQSMRYSDVSSTGEINMLVVVFQPFAASLFVKIPSSEFFESDTPLDQLEDCELKELSYKITETESDQGCIIFLEEFFLSRLRRISDYNIARISHVLTKIDAECSISINEMAEQACLSNKQFSRIFTSYVGASPKDFQRIVRMQRALSLLEKNPQISFSQLAYECGFSDQSHLIKEFRLFSGYTPQQYISICAPVSDYFRNE